MADCVSYLWIISSVVLGIFCFGLFIYIVYKKYKKSYRDAERATLVYSPAEIVSYRSNDVKSLKEAHDQERKQLEEQNRELKNRLAEQMHVKLAADESNFENISIPARPMNIADDYNLLCTSTWLNAKEQLDEFVEEQEFLPVCTEEWRTRFLCNILLTSYSISSEKFKQVKKSLEQLLLHPDESTVKVEDQCTMGLVDNALVSIGDVYRKTSPSLPLVNLEKETRNNIKVQYGIQKIGSHKSGLIGDVLNMKDVQEYLSKCVRLCWQMVLQRPAMSLDHQLVGSEWRNGENVQLMWGSNPKNDGATVRYYKYPMLLHGSRCMVKGEVFVE